MLSQKGVFVVIVSNLSARLSTVNVSGMDRYVVRSVIVKNVTTKP